MKYATKINGYPCTVIDNRLDWWGKHINRAIREANVRLAHLKSVTMVEEGKQS